MKKIIFILLFYNIIFAGNIKNWENLVYLQNDKKSVISDEFYLSSERNVEKEKIKMIELLKSDIGKKVACAFPARYQFLEENLKDIPKFDLNNCKELSDYLKSYGKDKLSIVFTSEYTNNPSSAFGHIMLLFSKDDEPIELSDAVHFAAKTSEKDNFFEYAYKGFTGRYNGYFIREPFFKKIYEYNILEQRYMYIFETSFNKSEIKSLLYHLFELRKAKFKYYFLDANCATKSADLLKILANIKKNNSIFYLPLETLLEFKDYINGEKRFIPLINKIYLLMNKMNNDEKRIFFRIIKNNERVDTNTPNIVKEALEYYTTFNFRRYKKVYKNYNNIMNTAYIPAEINDKSFNPLEKSLPDLAYFGFKYNDNSKIFLNYRPLFSELYDINYSYLQESEITAFSTELDLDDSLDLVKLDFVNIKSYPLQLKFYNPISWALYSGVNRINEHEDLLFNNEFSVGRTLMFFNTLKSSLFLGIGNDNNELYFTPKLYLNFFENKKNKIGLSTFIKKYKSKEFLYSELFSTFKIANNTYSIKYKNFDANTKNEISFSVKLKF